MRIAIIHGYFLSDSGSAVYVRELARELVRQGHEVTLVCQEQSPQDYHFIDKAYTLDPVGKESHLIFDMDGKAGRPGNGPGAEGSCRLVRPAIGRRLLTYVAGSFPGFDAVPFQDASDSEIDAYLDVNIDALGTIFSFWPPELVIANHLVAQPFIAKRALERNAPAGGARPPYAVTVHGSALNFTVKQDRRMAVYAREGIEGARAIIGLSRSSCEEVIAYASGEGLTVEDRCHVVPPGVDTHLFTPEAMSSSPEKTREGTDAGTRDSIGDTLLFVGRLLWTKGLQYAVAALPLVATHRTGVRLLVAGDGPLRAPLDEFISRLDAGDLDGAGTLAASDPELRGGEGYGPVLPPMDPETSQAYMETARGRLAGRIIFLGHRPHEELAPLYAAASIVLSPSVFPEAFALVSAEAMAGGAIPLATYQTGLRDPLDAVYGLLTDPIITSLTPGCMLTTAMADAASHLLEGYPTREAGFRHKLHSLANDRYSWSAVASRYLEFCERQA